MPVVMHEVEQPFGRGEGVAGVLDRDRDAELFGEGEQLVERTLGVGDEALRRGAGGLEGNASVVEGDGADPEVGGDLQRELVAGDHRAAEFLGGEAEVLPLAEGGVGVEEFQPGGGDLAADGGDKQSPARDEADHRVGENDVFRPGGGVFIPHHAAEIGVRDGTLVEIDQKGQRLHGMRSFMICMEEIYTRPARFSIAPRLETSAARHYIKHRDMRTGESGVPG